MKKKFQFFVCLLVLFTMITVINLNGQTTLYFQGFEGSCIDSWGFSGGVTNTETARTGVNSARVGRQSESNTITFNTINTTGLSNLQVQIYHSVRSGSGPGMDTREGALFLVSLNGGAYTVISGVSGSSDYSYPWSAASGGITNTCPSTFNTPNPLSYNVPAGTTSIAIKVISIGKNSSSCAIFNSAMTGTTGFNFDRSDEGFFIDDISLITTSPVTNVTWNGSVSTNWFCAANWTPAVVPTPAITANFSTSNTLPQRDIVLVAGTIAECNDLNISGGSANDHNIKGEGNPTKVLRVYGNLTLNGQDGLDFSDGTTGTPDGTIELKGNWDNQIGEADFKQGESSIIFNGTGTQNVTITGAGPEIFYNFQTNKASGYINLNDNVQVCGNNTDPLADRAGILTLTSGNIITNSFYLYISNPSVSAVTGGSTNSFVDGNFRRESNTINLYDYPCGEGTRFMRAGLRTTSTSLTVMEVDAQNNGYGIYVPLESSLFDVSHLRWWDITKISGSSNVNVRLYWLGTPTSEGITNVNDLVVAHYSNRDHSNTVSALQWWNRGRLAANSSGLVNDGYVEASETELTFSPHTFGTLTNSNPLPVELTSYNANCENGLINFTWSTSSELNNDHFEIEGSLDGITYVGISSVAGMGNSNIIENYSINYNNINRYSYFRLVQYDINGSLKYYNPVYVDCKGPVGKLSAVINGNNLKLILPDNFSSTYQYEIIDMNGRTLRNNLSTENGTILLDNFASGIYMIIIRDNENGSTASTKFYINR
jgi:hypothetical protein